MLRRVPTYISYPNINLGLLKDLRQIQHALFGVSRMMYNIG